MCGIAGIWTKGGDNSATASRMANRMTNRGPDDDGTWADPDAGIALGFRRLAILDLSPSGHQPMISECGRFVVVFNGEIYNHLELRVRLEEDRDVRWRGSSDTETLLQAVAAWGLDQALERSVGMYGLAVWDRRDRVLNLARDRMGEKPLYYGWSDGRLLFASELKALQAASGFDNPVDPDVLALYLRHNYVPAPWAILRDVYKIEPGCIVGFSEAALGHPPRTAPAREGAGPGWSARTYWSVGEVMARGVDAAMTREDATDELDRRLREAVRLQVVADVPVGAFLSGGIDSSAVVALMSEVGAGRVRTFTIGFDAAGYDEAPYARRIARHFGTDHTELYIDPDSLIDIVPKLPGVYCEPFADSSQIPTFAVSQLARRSVTVALSGDAGDELFGGYNRYVKSRAMWGAVSKVPKSLRRALGQALLQVAPAGDRWQRLEQGVSKLGRLLGTPLSTGDIYRASNQQWSEQVPLAFERELGSAQHGRTVAGRSPEEHMMLWDMTSYLPDDILAKVDRAAMANSLETRVPFLDHRVVELACRIPLDFKISQGVGKRVLRDVLSRRLPPELVDRPKSGFAIPVGAWLRGPLRGWAEELLLKVELDRDLPFRRAMIRQRWAQHLRGTHDWTGSIWGLLMFQAWRGEWDRTGAG